MAFRAGLQTVQPHHAVRLVMVAGLLLMVDLFLAPWYVQSFVIGDIEFTRTALEPPHGWLAVLAWLATIALLVEVVLSRVSSEGLPHLPVPWVRVQIVQAFGILALLGFKFVASAGHFGWGAWIGVALAGALAYGVWAAAQPYLATQRGGRRE